MRWSDLCVKIPVVTLLLSQYTWEYAIGGMNNYATDVDNHLGGGIARRFGRGRFGDFLPGPHWNTLGGVSRKFSKFLSG